MSTVVIITESAIIKARATHSSTQNRTVGTALPSSAASASVGFCDTPTEPLRGLSERRFQQTTVSLASSPLSVSNAFMKFGLVPAIQLGDVHSGVGLDLRSTIGTTCRVC